ncbi:hypothetical protein Ahy_Scaffold6g108051 [Arachis hypogaea]|uniref:DNA helicase Pif1-like 2B domain-containing protein n=1 Tax=Arachis hypogaea TaxID=3818 RepID=A0A444WP74_ARAHY|nr:hypothetical protein Ahy_Scaffold6g108051 [Arachis hypogaea]
MYLNSDNLCVDEGNMESHMKFFGPKVLNALNCSSLPPYKLTLKIGVLVMLLRNIDHSNGLCNGTRLQVRRFENHLVECEILTETRIRKITLIPRMNMVPNNDRISINIFWYDNQQGSRTDLYVALSRVKSKQGIKVLIQNYEGVSKNCTINI